mgnify:CR=1 FL=1
MNIEPTISWGDVSIATGMLIAGLLAFTDVSKGVTLNQIAVDHYRADLTALNAEYKEHLAQERQERQLMRDEVRADLQIIGAKLDKLIERQLAGAN